MSTILIIQALPYLYYLIHFIVSHSRFPLLYNSPSPLHPHHYNYHRPYHYNYNRPLHCYLILRHFFIVPHLFILPYLIILPLHQNHQNLQNFYLSPFFHRYLIFVLAKESI